MPSQDQLPLALELLIADHRKVELLFEEFDEQKEAEDDARRETAELICKELTIHAQIEEDVFYPWLRKALASDDVEMVEEAEVEHAGAKKLIAQIQGTKTLDDKYDAKVKVLSEYIKHHVKEEENEIFPEVRDRTEELDAVGQAMAARKAELLDAMGLTPHVERKPSSMKGRPDRKRLAPKEIRSPSDAKQKGASR